MMQTPVQSDLNIENERDHSVTRPRHYGQKKAHKHGHQLRARHWKAISKQISQLTASRDYCAQ